MMDVPANLLRGLKCCICEGYLSCGPIYTIVDNGKATCGRCNNETISSSNSPESVISEPLRARNFQYENLASIFQFPCKFALLGCGEKLLFSEEPAYLHELSCRYKPYVCPMLPNNQCDWCGPWHYFREHCEQAHPDNILENPYTSEPNFGEKSIKTYIIPCFNTVFLLRINISSERVIYSMYLLDDPAKITLYSFTVEVKRKHLSFCKPGKMGTADDLISQKLAFCIFTQEVLLKNVSGVGGTSFTINIKQTSRTIKCKFCSAQVENYEAQEWICNKCESKLLHCQNKNMKCTFKDINVQKVKKHELYFCKYVQKCFDCSGAVSAGKVFQHFDSCAHANTITSKTGLVWKATETPRRTLNYVLLRSTVIDKMFCKYYLDARQLSLILCTTHSSDQLGLYKCTIEVIDKETKYQQVFNPEMIQDFSWDWRIDVDFDLERYESVELDINVNFEKQNLL